MKVNKTLKVCGIYSIFNKINGFEYIGSTKLIYKRICEHFSMLRGNRHTNEYLQNAYNKYGEDAFDVKILEVCPLEKLHEREEYYISIALNKYNFNEKPTGPLKLPTPTEERKQKVSKANKGRKRTEDQRKRFSDSHIGLQHTEEQKQKISIALKEFYSIGRNRKPLSKETIQKIRETYLENHPDGRRVEWVVLVCPQCKKEFEVLPYMAEKQIYCSNECRTNSMIGRELTQEHKDSLSIAGKAFYSTEEGKLHLEKLQKATKDYFERHKIPFEIRTCICGCNETFEVKETSKKRYIAGHHKIEKQSEESNRKRSEAMKHFFATPKGIENLEALKISGLAGQQKQMAMKQKVKSNAN